MKTAVPLAAPAVRNTESPVPPQKATKFGDEAFVAVRACAGWSRTLIPVGSWRLTTAL